MSSGSVAVSLRTMSSRSVPIMVAAIEAVLPDVAAKQHFLSNDLQAVIAGLALVLKVLTADRVLVRSQLHHYLDVLVEVRCACLGLPQTSDFTEHLPRTAATCAGSLLFNMRLLVGPGITSFDMTRVMRDTLDILERFPGIFSCCSDLREACLVICGLCTDVWAISRTMSREGIWAP